MSTKITLLVCLGVCGGLAFTLQANHDIPVSSTLKLVTTVEGKSFFLDTPFSWNWTEAGEYCQSLRMKLADVTSKTQYDALRAAFQSEDFNFMGYWTSGRDAHLPRQFSWNTTGNAFSEVYGKLSNFSSLPFQTCVFYWNRSNNLSALYYGRCSEKLGVLCST